MFSGSGNTSNDVSDNQILRNHWGILINAPSANATTNLIRNNTVHDNGRAGIAILSLTASGNTVENNNVTGNGLLNLAPSLRFDLFAAGPPSDNVWRNNQGTLNFTATSQTNTIIAEALAPGGCMGPAVGSR